MPRACSKRRGLPLPSSMSCSRIRVLPVLFAAIGLIIIRQVHMWVGIEKHEAQSSAGSALQNFTRISSQHSQAKPNHDQVNFGVIADNPDADCIFRDSALYRAIYVYPSPGEKEWAEEKMKSNYKRKRNADDDHRILSAYGHQRNDLYPWQVIQNRTKTQGKFHFKPGNTKANQYTTELLIQQIMTHPDSCLRTYDPDKATLFYIPYLPSMEYHDGKLYGKNYKTSPYGQALLDAIQHGNMTGWEQRFGWTSKYWQRNQGSDHILVMSEPCHGLWHPQGRRGNFVYIAAQQQLQRPIVITVETSRTFVNMYPACAKTNILVPYPNTDGKWFNGYKYNESLRVFENDFNVNITQLRSDTSAALPAERISTIQKQKYSSENSSFSVTGNAKFGLSELFHRPRPLGQYYSAGNHGSCAALRKSMSEAFECSPTQKWVRQQLDQITSDKKTQTNGQSPPLPPFSFAHAYPHATFCPCPGGDTPSAKRMFDAILTGCIPIILSDDFVWPFTREAYPDINDDKNGDGFEFLLDPKDFSIRLNANDFIVENPCDDEKSVDKGTIQRYLERIPRQEIERLRMGVRKAAEVYGYYNFFDPSIPHNPLRDDVLPNGGAARAVVRSLEERVDGRYWPACQEELKRNKPEQDSVNMFKC